MKKVTITHTETEMYFTIETKIAKIVKILREISQSSGRDE